MALTPGTKLGPYEIVAPLGAGGMGEVYRARDPRLGRDVAIKVLPAHLSEQPEVRARFEREARTISTLNHPNICTLFDVGREPGTGGAGETDYLVMELIEGDTLAERLKRGALPANELLRIGAQIADALDRAHRAGVVHRDLKPGNIMLTRAGAKLMDFGLARTTGAAGPVSGSGATMGMLTHAPTVASPLTAEGAIVGTFQYMSPEQLEGAEADARSDIWALGCVLYEMATGRRAFEGRSQASLIAAILEREAPMLSEGPSSSGAGGSTASGSGTPPGLGRLVRACLAKDPEERIQTAHDVKLQLQWIAEGAGVSSLGVAPASGAGVAVAPRARGGASARIAWGVAALVSIAALVAGLWAWPKLSAKPPALRFRVQALRPGVTDAFWPRLSPDGTRLVYGATDSTGTKQAYLLRLDELDSRPIPGTVGLQRAYWSPDGREIAFCANNKLMRVDLAGGTPVTVCPAPGGADLSWSPKGVILLDGSTTDSLRSVPANGGDLKPAARVSRADHEVGSAWPCFLPDGEHFLFCGIRDDGGSNNVRLGKLGSLDSKIIGRTDGRAEFAPGGWLLTVRRSALVAQKLDVGAGKVVGEPITLVDDIRTGTSAGHFSVSANGLIAFMRSTGGGSGALYLADRTGKFQGPAIATSNLGIANPHFSPDGKRMLFERHSDQSSQWGDLYMADLERGGDSRLTTTNGRVVSSAWSPDGRRFAYAVQGSGGAHARIWVASSDGVGGVDSLIANNTSAFLSQWHPAPERVIGYDDSGRLFSLAPDAASGPSAALLDSTVLGVEPQISPDGRYVAYVTGTIAIHHVYVQNLTGAPRRWQISTAAGGHMPFWTKGGRELVYESMLGMIMAVPVDTRTGFSAGTPVALFHLPVVSYSRDLASWSVDASGERFALATVSNVTGEAGGIEIFTDFSRLVQRK